MNSSVGLPFRIILTSSALFQIYVYVFVVLYSLYIGGIDLVLPIKSSYLSTLIILIVLAVGDVRTEWRNHSIDLSRLGLSIYRLISEVVASIGLFALGYFLLLEPLSSINLTHLSFEVKSLASVGVLSMVAFSVTVIIDLLGFKRKGELPQIADKV